MTTHPYEALPPRAYWRTGVADVSALDISDLYSKRFPLPPTAGVASLGSCFAQHIGRRLAANGFNYLDVEPAPRHLPAERRQAYGYGLFSARSGNVYGARQLLQLLRRSRGQFTPAADVWKTKGRFYDPFRPGIEEGGFGAADEVRASRASHLAALRRLFDRVEVFIFTLGLTECWVDARDGAAYPLCPGAGPGTFDPRLHRFANFTYSEILADMEDFISELRQTNPDVRIILTVSPVPLTATASGEHVVSATMLSKSILRAVAGELRSRHAFVDYFPSYEIISSPAFEARFFEENKRSVRTEGVDHVMSHFFGEHRPPDPRRMAKRRARVGKARQAALAKFNAQCDEETLDAAAAR